MCDVILGSRHHRGANRTGSAGIGQRSSSSDSREGTTSSGTPIHYTKLKARARDEASQTRNRKVRARSQQRHGNIKPVYH